MRTVYNPFLQAEHALPDLSSGYRAAGEKETGENSATSTDAAGTRNLVNASRDDLLRAAAGGYMAVLGFEVHACFLGGEFLVTVFLGDDGRPGQSAPAQVTLTLTDSWCSCALFVKRQDQGEPATCEHIPQVKQLINVTE